MKTALVCIAKNEDLYIQEWIDYNKKLGFDKIFIYENNWRCNIEDPILVKIPYDGLNKQVEAYNHFIQNYKNEYDYAAFFDVDEFLVLKKHKTVNEFITEYQNSNGIGVNWVWFGSGGKLTIEESGVGDSVLKRFIKKENTKNEGMKTILNLKSHGLMVLPHNPNIPIFDTDRRIIYGPANPNGSTDIAQLNHYFFKSYEEYVKKCERGRADMVVSNRTADVWYKHINDNIEIEDTLARDFLYGN